MIKGINGLKTLTNIYHANLDVNLIEQNVIQINGGITINVNVGVKRQVCEKLKSCYMQL